MHGGSWPIWACSDQGFALPESRPDCISRFAPSPTGYLHKGHAYSAMLAHDFAKKRGGQFLVRIEDIDSTRCRKSFTDAILEDLHWLGLDFEQPVRYQSDHLQVYEAAIEDLRQRGLLYRCFKTRKELVEETAFAPHGPATPYFGEPIDPREEAQLLQAGKPFAWRLSLRSALISLGNPELTFSETGKRDDAFPETITARPELFGDIVLGRKDIRIAYHLAVVMDDALQGVTHIVRGADLAEATHIQRLLQALLGLPTPVYHHHALITGPDGRRLAKRDHAETLQSLRAQGVTPAQLRSELGM